MSRRTPRVTDPASGSDDAAGRESDGDGLASRLYPATGPDDAGSAAIGPPGTVGHAVSLAGIVASYHVLLRPWHRTWGATAEEVDRRLPGDELVPEPCDETTRAITVEAPADDVWP
jgi:hypothetical protein